MAVLGGNLGTMNCGDCRHWLRPQERVDYQDALTYDTRTTPGPIDSYDAQVARSEEAAAKTEAADLLYGACTVVKLNDELPFDDQPPLATTRDLSNAVATLFTQEQFSCAMWQAAEVPATV